MTRAFEQPEIHGLAFDVAQPGTAHRARGTEGLKSGSCVQIDYDVYHD